MERLLERLTEKLKSAAGDNLRSVVLYGSAASGEFRRKHSDFNVLCILRRNDSAELADLHGPAKWWARKGQPAPLVFTEDELRRSADFYAIELLEIKQRRKVLFGEDLFERFEPPMDKYKLQVERELRHGLVRLRQNYLLAAGSRRAVMALMVRSYSTFAVLFRHALVALGEDGSPAKQEAVERLARVLGFSAASFEELGKLRRGEIKARNLDAERVFSDYLKAVTRAVDEIDRRLAS